MNNEELYNFLIKLDVIPKDQLDEIFSQSKNSNVLLEDLIFSENLFNEDEILTIKSMIKGLPKANLDKKIISKESLSKIPEEISRNYGAVCFLDNQDGMHIACYSEDVIDKLDKFLPEDKKKLFFLDSSSNIKKVLQQYQENISEELGFRISNLSKKAKKLSDYGTESFVRFFPDDYLMEISDDIYTRRIIDIIIENALIKESDSVTISGEHGRTKLLYRLGSKNLETATLDDEIIHPIVLSLRRQGDIDLSKDELVQNGYFITKVNRKDVFVVFNIIKTVSGYRVSLDISENNQESAEAIESMIQSTLQIETLYKKISQQRGLIVLSGSTKSGKTRTFYNLLKILQRKKLDVFTIEKKPELNLFGISQISAPLRKRTFSKLIDKISFQNPDVIGISDMYQKDFVKILNQTQVGKLMICEYKKGFLDLFERLKKLNYSNETLDRIVSACVSHKTFSSYINLEKISLKKNELKSITKIIPEEQLHELLLSSGVIKKGQNMLDIFYSKTKKSKKNKDKIYVRGVVDIKQEVSFQKDTKKTIEFKLKRAILENAVILSARGIVDIKDVIKFIK